MHRSECFDVVIIGGGPAGASAAITLAEKGFRIAIVERSSYNTRRIGETLPPSIRHPLSRLGLWQNFLEDKHLESFAIRSSWSISEAYERNHIFDPYGSGWHVDRAKFDIMLMIAAKEIGADIFTQSNITHISHEEGQGWRIIIVKDE